MTGDSVSTSPVPELEDKVLRNRKFCFRPKIHAGQTLCLTSVLVTNAAGNRAGLCSPGLYMDSLSVLLAVGTVNSEEEERRFETMIISR